MACVVLGSLVEAVTSVDPYIGTSHVELVPVERLRPGDYVNDPRTNTPLRVSRVIVERGVYMYDLYRVGGLRAQSNQWVDHCGGWRRVDSFAPASREKAYGIAALILETGKQVRVDGVVCAVYRESEVREVEEARYRVVRVRLGERCHRKTMAFGLE